MITFQPAGKMEEFFIAVAEGIMKNTTPEQREAIRRAHGFESTGDRTGYLKKIEQVSINISNFHQTRLLIH